ncbi:MAG: STAS domain-containing protein [Spirochaetes bacterium]|nr:STAS domain-containing protein [Spirochaetota bacterium]
MYTVERKDNYVIIRNTQNRAEIEFNNISELSEVLKNLMEEGEKKILIDFKNVVYIDSAGLGVLLDTMKKLKANETELGILSISKDVLEVFTATKIAQYFKFYKNI